MKKIIPAVIAVGAVLGLAACSDASVASHNISRESDYFKVDRRIVFLNGITDTYLLSIEGKCSIEPDMDESQLEVTCKVADGEYKKHFLGLSDNVTYFIEQLETSAVSAYHYKVMFKPEAIIPDIDLKTSGGDN
ncbi:MULTISPECIES: beta-sandwich lipoprotein [unclassified Leucobacter]|uniref:beta-sandwich lipoprotein n=1 Tax=unclassified Leucobacter TaxID=2621730 RepID=UPI003017A2C8